MKIVKTLPFVKETKGAVLYGLTDRAGEPVSNLYVRKDALPRNGGAWPAEITVTVDVPGAVTR